MEQLEEDQDVEKETFPDFSTSPRLIPISLSIWEETLDKISRKVLMRQHQGFYNETKAQWVIDAIRERLDEESKNSSFKTAHHPKTTKGFTFRVGKDLLKKIQKHILVNKKIKHPGYTRNEWILEAIQKKLDQESKKPN